jgi:(2Fe-2S) ferredoxin
VAVTACDCLGPCFDGPNVVIYPEGVWYAGVGAGDARELTDEHLTGGRVVDRLVFQWPTDDE